jgi:ribosome modulation factor
MNPNPYRHDWLRRCWERGRNAAVDGQPCEPPPYRLEVSRMAWQEGWDYWMGREREGRD